MKDKDKTKEQLINELVELRKWITELEELQGQRRRTAEELHKLSRAVEQSPTSIVITDTQGNIEYVNPKFCGLTGYTLEEVMGQNPRVLKSGEQPQEFYKQLWDTITSGNEWRGEFHNKKKTGELYWEIATISPVRNVDGMITHFLAIKEDITERKRSDEKIRQQNEFLNNVIESLSYPFYVINANDYTVEIANSAANLGDLSKDSTCYALSHRRSEPCDGDHKCPLEEIKKTKKSVTAEHIHFDKDGNSSFVEVHCHPIFDDKGTVVKVIEYSFDITDRKEMEEAVRYQAYHDVLTGLPNRLLFNDRLQMAIVNANRYQQKLAVFFLDLDRFKSINDSLGHTVGDKLLQSTAHRLTNSLRRGDTVARPGGDEYTILLPEIKHEEDTAKIAKKILSAFKKPWMIEGNELHITPSIGISLYPDDGQDAGALVKHADIAMYHAKEQGRNNFQFYTPELNVKAYEQIVLENSLRRAIGREEFVLFYQPQLDVEDGQIVGVEALIRWQHPDLDLLYPKQFIPLAEETGLIIPIDAWVLRAACLQNKRWQEAGFRPMRVAINLSSLQFRQPNLVAMVEQVLDETSLDPYFLELEITESIAMHNEEVTITKMHQLSKLGIKFSIDDFGSGYSSLRYLKKLPIQTLKIDRMFITDVTTNPGDAAIVDAVISMAHGLNLKVIAEGVETKEQANFLREYKCDEMQGYLCGRPLPVKEVTKLLAEERCFH